MKRKKNAIVHNFESFHCEISEWSNKSILQDVYAYLLDTALKLIQEHKNSMKDRKNVVPSEEMQYREWWRIMLLWNSTHFEILCKYMVYIYYVSTYL